MNNRANPRLSRSAAEDGETGAASFADAGSASGRARVAQAARWILPGLVMLALSGIVGWRLLRADVLKHRQAAMTQSARAVAGVLSEMGIDGVRNLDVESLCHRFHADTGMRLTLMDHTGRVLGDSFVQPFDLPNDPHGGRDEVIQAHRTGTGRAIRVSSTTGRRELYVAQRVPAPAGHTGDVVRVSLPLDEVYAGYLAVPARRFGLILLMVVLGVWLGGFLRLRAVMRPVEAMGKALERYRQGDLSYRIPTGLHGIHQPGIERLHRMADRLQGDRRALMAERAQRDAILASMSEGVLALDMQRRILMMNTAAGPQLGLKSDEVAGRPVHEVVRNAAFIDCVDAVFAADGPLEQEIEIRDGGTQRFLWVHGSPLRFEAGTRSGSVLVFSDMTALRRLERIRRDFVANVSHELKTPITSIKGFVETLLEDKDSNFDPQTHTRFLGIIGRQAEHLDRILNDLLLLSRVEHLSETLPATSVASLAEMIHNAVEICTPRVTARGVQIVVKTNDSTLEFRGYPNLVEQALVNLIDNAIKYGPSGGEVCVEGDADADAIRVSVRDQGPGIESRHLERVFERFYRVDHGRSREMGGTGLGLSIVRHIALLHQGVAEVESRVGQGSTFRLRLPRESRF